MRNLSDSKDISESKDMERKPFFSFPGQLSTSGLKDSARGYLVNALPIDLSGPVSFSCWLLSAETERWRSFISIESSQCESSLLTLGLASGSTKVYFVYYKGDEKTRVTVTTGAVAPGPNVFFHLAFVLSGQNATVYINGRKESCNSVEQSLFNPRRKFLVMGRNKYANKESSPWNGEISQVKIFDYCLSQEEVMEEANEPPMRYVAPTGA